MSFSVVILAAGMGTRMKSALPKVLHEAAGRPLVEHVVRSVQPLEPQKIILVIGNGAEQVRRRMQHHPVEFVLQEKQLGTGHALMQTEQALKDQQGDVMVLNGDGPLLKTETLARLLETQNQQAGMTLITLGALFEIVLAIFSALSKKKIPPQSKKRLLKSILVFISLIKLFLKKPKA
jgi:bifunctional N-acetylglucosamine-1-phosphate-uridyltransferase/glucosamine-1-phosphate-acetyltransferase GlmU-like protein